MIIVRSLATFQADFPDDCIEDDFDIVVQGGRNVTEAIRDILVANDCTDTKLHYGGDHGWELTFVHQGYPLWMQLTRIDPEYILTCKESPGMSDGSGSPPHLKALLMLNEQLRRDERFHDLVWYRHRDYLENRPGSNLPAERVAPLSDTAKSKQGILKSLLAVFRSH
jgi:hypothetical protein